MALETAPDVAWVRTSARDLHVLDASCEGVGPVHAGLGEPGAPAEPIDSLYVITWNVHVGGGDLRCLVADLRAGELTGGRPVDSYVLLLQEVHRAGPEVPATATPDALASGIASVPPSGERHDVVEAARSLGLNVLNMCPRCETGRVAWGWPRTAATRSSRRSSSRRPRQSSCPGCGSGG